MPFATLGIVLGAIAASGSLGALVHGRIARRYGAVPSVVGVVFASLPFAIVAAITGDAVIAIAALALRAFFMYGSTATWNAITFSSFTPSERAGVNAVAALAWAGGSGCGRGDLRRDPRHRRLGRLHREPADARRLLRGGGGADLRVLPPARSERRRWRGRDHCARLTHVTTPARDLVAAAFADALGRAARQYGWQGWESEPVKAEVPAHAEHGDYATGIAMRLARTLRKPPREIATAIKDQLDLRPPLASAEVAGGGFVNVRLDVAWLRGQVDAIIREGADYGRSSTLHGKRIQVEFVSANPTGPLTLANARGGPLGDVLASVLQFSGANVQREYYVEDGGTQVERFGISVAVRYRQLFGEDAELPADAYQGDYVKDIATQIKDQHGDLYRTLSLEEQGRVFGPMAIDWVVADAQRVTAKFGIKYDSWLRQSSFIQSGYVSKTIDELRKRGVIVEREGVVFFETPEAVALRREGEEGWVLVAATAIRHISARTSPTTAYASKSAAST